MTLYSLAKLLLESYCCSFFFFFYYILNHYCITSAVLTIPTAFAIVASFYFLVFLFYIDILEIVVFVIYLLFLLSMMMFLKFCVLTVKFLISFYCSGYNFIILVYHFIFVCKFILHFQHHFLKSGVICDISSFYDIGKALFLLLAFYYLYFKA